MMMVVMSGRHVMMMVVMIKRRVMRVLMMMIFAPQNDRADDIDDKAQKRHDKCLLVMNGRGLGQAFHRTENHHARNHEKEKRAREATQDFDFPGAECKTGIVGVTARRTIGKSAHADRQ